MQMLTKRMSNLLLQLWNYGISKSKKDLISFFRWFVRLRSTIFVFTLFAGRLVSTLVDSAQPDRGAQGIYKLPKYI